jgi:hypothetical protein
MIVFMDDWKPLRQQLDQTLVQGVQEYMFDPLSSWIEEAEELLSVQGYRGKTASPARESFVYDFDCMSHRRSKLSTTSSTDRFRVLLLIDLDDEESREADYVYAPSDAPDMMLDYIDYLLRHLREAQNDSTKSDYTHERCQELCSNLDHILERAGSAWRTGLRNHHYGLVERVNPTVDEAADKAMSEAGDAGTLLAESWGQLFGRNPNPSEAYRTTVKAVEAATKPSLCPNDDRYTLGKGLSAMRNQHQCYVIDVRDDQGNTPPHNVDGGVIQLMMRSIWESQRDRHAGNSDSAPITSEEARAAIYLAVPIIQAFHDGLVYKPE